jgi:cytochrome c553
MSGPGLALAACSAPEAHPGPWEETGELIALSGGDAGARGACITCHGLRGEGDGNLAPRLAGLDPGYMARQLEYFSAGYRRHPQMEWIADQLGWPARQNVSFYYAAMDVPQGVQAVRPSAPACSPAVAHLYHRGDPARGIEACASCHGDDGQGVGQGNPPLADQPAPYLAQQLRHWRSGERYGDPLDAMTHVSRLLAEREIDPLSEYSAALQGSTSYPEPLAACLRTRRPDPRSGA